MVPPFPSNAQDGVRRSCSGWGESRSGSHPQAPAATRSKSRARASHAASEMNDSATTLGSERMPHTVHDWLGARTMPSIQSCPGIHHTAARSHPGEVCGRGQMWDSLCRCDNLSPQDQGGACGWLRASRGEARACASILVGPGGCDVCGTRFACPLVRKRHGAAPGDASGSRSRPWQQARLSAPPILRQFAVEMQIRKGTQWITRNNLQKSEPTGRAAPPELHRNSAPAPQRVILECRRELEPHWQFCAHCGARLATHCRAVVPHCHRLGRMPAPLWMGSP